MRIVLLLILPLLAHGQNQMLLSFGKPVYDSIAQAYFDKAVTNGGFVTPNYKGAISAYCKCMRDSGQVSGMIAEYETIFPVAGVDAINLWNVNTHALTIVGSPNLFQGGWVGNSSSYGITDIVPSSYPNNFAMGIYQTFAFGTGTFHVMGSNTSTTERCLVQGVTTPGSWDAYNNSSCRANYTSPDAVIDFWGSRESSSFSAVYTEGVQRATLTSSCGTIPAINCAIDGESAGTAGSVTYNPQNSTRIYTRFSFATNKSATDIRKMYNCYFTHMRSRLKF